MQTHDYLHFHNVMTFITVDIARNKLTVAANGYVNGVQLAVTSSGHTAGPAHSSSRYRR